MELIEQAKQYLLLGAMIILSVTIFFCLLRTVIGPRITDRIVGVNMIGTQVIIMIALLAVYKKEGYLVDISLIYAMLSFLSAVVLSKIYIGVYNERQRKKEEKLRKQKDAGNPAAE